MSTAELADAGAADLGEAPSGRAGRACSPLFLSTYRPAECEIAEFTTNLADAVDGAAGAPISAVAAIDRAPMRATPKGRVAHSVERDSREAYLSAAQFANEHPCDVVSIQHEFGLFAGQWGEAVLDFARACRKPMAATLHSVRSSPRPQEAQVIRGLAELCARVIAMTGAAANLLDDVYGVPAEKIVQVPCGVQVPDLQDNSWLTHRLSIAGGPLLLTCGLLGPHQGVEYMIEAMQGIVRCCPRAVYHVVGRTHFAIPDGEAYRESLRARASQLGIASHVHVKDQFLTSDELLLYIQSSDVFISPYTDAEWAVSGTLARALAAGKPTVATPYPHAREVARQGALLLAGFRSSRSLEQQVLRMLDHPELRMRLSRRARELSRAAAWERVGARYHDLFVSLARESGEEGALRTGAAQNAMELPQRREIRDRKELRQRGADATGAQQ